MLLWNRYGLYFKWGSLEVVGFVDRGRAGILVRLMRLHVLRNEKLDKLNRLLYRIMPRAPTVEVVHNDARCLVIDIPGPIGFFWWCLQP